MKLDQLRKIIREEVKSAVKEGLQDILNEAVKVASTPNTGMAAVPKGQEKKWSVGKSATLDEMLSNQKPKAGSKTFTKNSRIQNVLEQTQAAMTGEEYKSVYAGSSDMVKKPNFASSMASNMGIAGNQPGIDISKLDFIGKAKSILDAANKKDETRLR